MKGLIFMLCLLGVNYLWPSAWLVDFFVVVFFLWLGGEFRKALDAQIKKSVFEALAEKSQQEVIAPADRRL